MIWRRLDTTPIDIDTGVAPVLAQLVAAALTAHAVPIVVQREGRAEPLASGVFYRVGTRLWLVTCRHLLDDGVVLGDLGVALPAVGRVRWLRDARARVLAHPEHDLAAILIGAAEAERDLLRAWPVLPLPTEAEANAPAQALVLAAYPYAQMKRIDAVLHARPVVVFARLLDAGRDVLASYAYTALRADGLAVRAPALDGASGATLWALRAGPNDGQCVLRPAAVQFAFKHDAYMRGAPFSALRGLMLSSR
jgi:hypothetical protein